MLKTKQTYKKIRYNHYGTQEIIIKKDITNLCTREKDKFFDDYYEVKYNEEDIFSGTLEKLNKTKIYLQVLYCKNHTYYKKDGKFAGYNHIINIDIIIKSDNNNLEVPAYYYSTDSKEKSFNILKNYLKENNILFDNKQINKHIFEEILSQEKIYKFANEYYVKKSLLDYNSDYNILLFEEGLKTLIKADFIKQFGVLDKAYQTTEKGREYLKSIYK